MVGEPGRALRSPSRTAGTGGRRVHPVEDAPGLGRTGAPRRPGRGGCCRRRARRPRAAGRSPAGPPGPGRRGRARRWRPPAPGSARRSPPTGRRARSWPGGRPGTAAGRRCRRADLAGDPRGLVGEHPQLLDADDVGRQVDQLADEEVPALPPPVGGVAQVQGGDPHLRRQRDCAWPHRAGRRGGASSPRMSSPPPIVVPWSDAPRSWPRWARRRTPPTSCAG